MSDNEPDTEKVNILLVDDQPAGLLTLESVLKDLDQNLVQARSGKEALRHLLAQEFAVILLDVQMPGMDGYEVATAIRERASSRVTPLIFLTASHQADVHMFRGYAVGAVDYMLKPLNPDVLRSKVAVFVELAKKSALIQKQNAEQKTLEEELRRKNEELEKQNRRVEEANRLKSEFLANMSHELRTPLNGIIGFAELMHDGKVGPVSDEHHEYLGDILTSSRHLLQLINDVLDLAKVESGKLEFRPEPVDLTKVVGEVRDILRTLVARKRIRVETRVDPAITGVVLDPAKLKQLLYNYLSNAVKFTPDEGRIDIRVLPEGADWFRIEVQNTGIGIRPEDIARLFVEFQQLDTSAAKKYAGTGLGLALTKRLVEAQGGEVGVRSTPGEGSVFFAVLPRVMKTRAGGEAASVRAARTSRGQGPTILIVEDDDGDQAWLTRVLGEAGYETEVARTGADAIVRCRERAFAAIVLDLFLPDMVGWDVLRAIRVEGRNTDVPVIVATVVSDRGSVAGFSVHDFLVKPLRADDLVESLKRAGVPADGAHTVMVVDDDVIALKLMEKTITQLKYRPICHSDAEAALGGAAKEPRRPSFWIS